MESVFDNKITEEPVIDEASPLRRLPPDLLSSLDADKLQKIEEAMIATAFRRHPVNIRLGIPFLGDKYYLTIFGGREQRSPERLVSERKQHKLGTIANCFFMIGAACFFYLIFFTVIALQSKLVEF